jgi:uncharacterized membrane protein
MAEQKPQTKQDLVKLLLGKVSLSTKQINQVLLDLENENKIRFTKQDIAIDASFQEYVFSKKAAWYWKSALLAIITVLTVFLIPENAYPLIYIRISLGIIFIMFLPGFALMKMLFPAKMQPRTSKDPKLDLIERNFLCVGLSMVLVPIIGLGLNFLPFGLRLTPIVLGLLLITLVCATAAVFREYQLPSALNQKRECS